MARTQIRKTRKAARSTRTSTLLGILTVLGLLVLTASPALAHHKDGHDKGSSARAADDRSGSDHDGDAGNEERVYTEDNDTNDGDTKNNVSDDGDNAHPSGKDRSVENPRSGNQGKAESDPDDDGRGPERSNGGPDKPNGSGGSDKADQDGNNGCGNDDDFEDDNEGLCLGRQGAPKPAKPTKPDVRPDEVGSADVCPAGTDNAGEPMDSLADCFDDDVLGRTDRVCPAGTAKAGEDMASLADCDEVLGKLIRKATPQVRSAAPAAVKGAVLPFTGSSLIGFLIAALTMIAAGITALKVRSNS